MFAVATFLICTLAALSLPRRAGRCSVTTATGLADVAGRRARGDRRRALPRPLGLLALGLGFALRNTAGAIATLFGSSSSCRSSPRRCPHHGQDHIDKYLPLPAGSAILATVQDSGSLGPWTGLGVFALYAVAALAVGVVVLRRRDA